MTSAFPTACDLLIVGGGSAGCVLANRLSADSRRHVVLAEAGPDTPPGQIPADIADLYPIRAFYNRGYYWPPFSVTLTAPGHAGSPARRATYEQARIMGGGSTVNGMMALRGLPSDYDSWAGRGCQGWAWDDVLPAFRRLERDLDELGDHGDDGPIAISRASPSEWSGFSRAISDALRSEGLATRSNHNADFADGAYPLAVSADRTGRVSTAMGYLDAATRARPNLTILPGTTVQRLVAEGRAIVGAEIFGPGGSQRLAARETIVSAGALQSPALLLRAGIGPAADLVALGIPVVADLPAVGHNLNEHPVVAIAAHLRRSARLGRSAKRHIHMVVRYSSGSTGCPPGDMLILPVARAGWHPLGQRLSSTLAWVNHPFSRGQLRIKSPDPGEPPDIAFNLLSDERDLWRLSDGFRRVAALYAHPAVSASITRSFPAAYGERVRRYFRVSRANTARMAIAALLIDTPLVRNAFIDTVVAPGASVRDLLSDASALKAWLLANVTGGWHACGTCRMGAPDDGDAVVDPRCRVRGVAGLRVIDASVMPFAPSANTNIPTIMIAEHASDRILAQA